MDIVRKLVVGEFVLVELKLSNVKESSTEASSEGGWSGEVVPESTFSQLPSELSLSPSDSSLPLNAF